MRRGCPSASQGETTVTKPTINVNGTSAKELLDQRIATINALRYAISTLQAAAPNGRDCQTAPLDAFAAAINEPRSRLLRSKA